MTSSDDEAHTRRRRRNRRSTRSRHSKHSYTNNAARFVTLLIFFGLVVYEIFVLKAPLSADLSRSTRILNPDSSSSSSSTHKARSSSTSSSPHSPPPQPPPQNPAAAAAAAAEPAQPVVRHVIPEPPQNAPALPVAAPVEPPPPPPVVQPPPPNAAANPPNALSEPVTAPQAPDSPPMAEAPIYRPLKKRRRKRRTKKPASSISDTPASVPQSATVARTSGTQLGAPADEDTTSGSGSGATASNRQVTDGASESTARITTSRHAAFAAKSTKREGTQGRTRRTRNGSDDTNGTQTGGSVPGADADNFWQWFQESKGSEKEALSTAVKCETENGRLCRMLYKYVHKYKVRSVYDVSCVKNLAWLPEVIRKASEELWGFRFFCSVTEPSSMSDAQKALSGLKSVEFVTGHWWREGFSKGTELLFAWDTLPHIAYGRVWNFFVKAKRQQVKYILIDNYPGIMNDPSPKRHYINLRKHPFKFPAAKEVVQNVTEPGEKAKRQLLFYETEMLPNNLE